MKNPLFSLFLLCLVFWHSSLSGQNNSLHFDGCDDFIYLNPIAGWNTNNSDFSVQVWFTSEPDILGCNANFRRLFVVSIPHRFEVGQCGGNLKIFWTGTPGSPGVVNIPANINDGNWHCIGVVRMGPTVEIYLDGAATPIYSNNNFSAILNTSLFNVGHWHGFLTCGQDWLGEIDEVRLWNIPLTPAELTACGPCVLTGTEPGLIAYWRLDEGLAGQSNVGITTVEDCSPFNNDGTLYPYVPNPSNPNSMNTGHDLTSPNGNFELSGAPLLYPEYTKLFLDIEKPGPVNTSLTEICSGDPVKFCLRDLLGNMPPPGAPFAPVITWKCSNDGGITFNNVPYNGFNNNQFCFTVPPGEVTSSNCSAASPGYEDKIFYAEMTVTDPNNPSITCTYQSSWKSLRICCPVAPQPTVVANVLPPGTLNGTLCEGDVITLDVSLTGHPAWLPPTGGSVATIDWCIDDGQTLTPIPSASGLTQFTLPMTVGMNDFCIRAKIQNCACPPVEVETCFKVDKNPVCGSIIECDPALMPVTAGCPPGMLCYEICPYEDAAVWLDPTTTFQHCIPHWEFSFDNVNWTSPLGGPLGVSNSIQQTNTLPCDDIGSPYQWPAGVNCIYYRVLCHPLNTPSGCEPCTTNVIRVCLKPAIPPIVAISQNKICDGTSSLLSVTNPLPGIYTWYCNGLPVGNGTTYPATEEAYYWVTHDDGNGCDITVSNQVFLTVCKVKAVISCPLSPNPCATPGLPIFLDSGSSCGGIGCGSSSTCGGPLTCTWSVSPAAPPLIINGCNVQHTPPLTGATYTLTVTDPCGCSATTSKTIVPCP